MVVAQVLAPGVRSARRPRPERPRVISEAARASVVALACQLPAATGVPLARWSGLPGRGG
jgi:hypothetical protein